MLADLGQRAADPDRRRARSRSAATSRRRRARWSSATPLYELIQYSADDREGAGDAAGDLPAVDQPLLHPRSQPGEELHPLGGRAGADRVHGVVEVGRREHDATSCWDDYVARADRRDRHGARRCSTCRRSTRSAIASRARRSPRRWRCSTARGEADKVASATFFTAQVDFAEAGDSQHFVDDEQLTLIEQLSRRRAISTAATWRRRSTCCAAAT